MCYGCYEEAGKPQIDTREIRESARLIEELYLMPDGGVGGNLHIVTDDWNLKSELIKFCADVIAKKRAGFGDQQNHAAPEQLGLEQDIVNLLLPMSEAERASALGLWEGYWKPAPVNAGIS